MRRAELACALGLVAAAGIAAWYAQELPIGWVRGSGPGGGFFPFWLSVMIGALVAVHGVQVLLQGPASRPSAKPFLKAGGLRELLKVAIPAFVMVALIDLISTYFAAAIFLAYYTRWIGKHPWHTVLPISIGVPTGIFLLFEKLLLVPLPKGYLDQFYYLFY